VQLARREAYFHAERLGALSDGGDLAARRAMRERVKAVLSEPPEPVLFDQTGRAHSVETWAALLKPLGIEGRMAPMRAAAAFERRRMEEMKPLPEVKKFLEIVKRSHRLYILAGGDSAHQKLVLRRMRMDEMVDAIVYEEELGLRRPDRALFEKVLDRAGAKAKEAAFAGDDPCIDLSGAKAAGIFTIWRRTEGPRTRGEVPPADAADYVVESFLELFPRLERRMGER